jgi:pyrimidine operon attenuation protein/uracil phosphoribosyltransferase
MIGTRAESEVEVDNRERLLIEAVVTLARTLRDERDRLAERLREVENELQTLTMRLERELSASE